MAKKLAAKKATVKKGPGRKAGVKVGPYKKTLKDADKPIIPKPNQQTAKVEEVKKKEDVISLNNNDNTNVSANDSSDNNSQPNLNEDEARLNSFVEANASKDEYKIIEQKPITQIEQKAETTKDGYNIVKKNYSEGMKKLISGKMLLSAMNMVTPTVVIKLVGLFKKEVKEIKPKDIRLTEDQREDMKEVADEIAAYIFDHISPIQAFLFMYGVCTYDNLSEALEAKREEAKA